LIPKDAQSDLHEHQTEEPAINEDKPLFVSELVSALRAIAQAGWTYARPLLTRQRALLAIILAVVLVAALLFVRLLRDNCVVVDCDTIKPPVTAVTAPVLFSPVNSPVQTSTKIPVHSLSPTPLPAFAPSATSTPMPTKLPGFRSSSIP
jgi:hypothetical protein